MFERFTDRARRVLVLAQEQARVLNHNFIGTEHLLMGLILEGEGVAATALESLGITFDAVREKVEETIGPAGSSTTNAPAFTRRSKEVLELSLRESLELGHNYIGTEHLLLGLLRKGEGVAVQVLVTLGVDLSRVREQVIGVLSGLSSGEQSVDESVATGPGGPARPSPSGPRCPSCRGLLEGHVAYRILTVGPTEPASVVGKLRVAFVYCLRCGVTIAHTSTVPDELRGSG